MEKASVTTKSAYFHVAILSANYSTLLRYHIAVDLREDALRLT